MISASEARANLTHILDQVEGGEEVVISRHGKAVAVVVRPDALRVRRAGTGAALALDVHHALDAARRQPLPKVGISPKNAERRVAELRVERDND